MPALPSNMMDHSLDTGAARDGVRSPGRPPNGEPESPATEERPLVTTAFAKLKEFVHQAETRARAEKIGDEARHASERLRAAWARVQAAQKQVIEVRPVCLRQQEEAQAEAKDLDQLIHKICHIGPDSQPGVDVTALVEAARAEIGSKAREAQATLEAIARESRDARVELQAAVERYEAVRREVERLQPELASELGDCDLLMRESDREFPERQIQALALEIEDGSRHFGMLRKPEQFAQLKIWIGRFRRIEALIETGVLPRPSEQEKAQFERLHPRLVAISHEFMPGYIEAFNRNFLSDWDEYIVEAQEALLKAGEEASRSREQEGRRNEVLAREQERLHQLREAAREALEELKGVITRYHLPDEGADEYRAVLKRVVEGYGPPDAELLELVTPYRDLLTGSDFRNLRKRLDQVTGEEAREREDEESRELYQDLIQVTRSLRVLMIGGSPREETRRLLQRTFAFADLTWEPHENNKPALLKSLEERVSRGGIDLVLLLRFIGHNVSEKFRPLCKERGIPCAMLERGYGPSQVAEALRRVLPRVT